MGSITRTCNIGHNTTITTNFHLCLDRHINTTDTADWITVLGSTNTFESMITIGIGAGVDPGVTYGHFITMRLKKNVADSTTSTHYVELQLIKAGSIGIAAMKRSGDLGSYNTYQYELTKEEVAKLEHSYNDLTFNIVGFGDETKSSDIAWISLEYPQLIPCQ